MTVPKFFDTHPFALTTADGMFGKIVAELFRPALSEVSPRALSLWLASAVLCQCPVGIFVARVLASNLVAPVQRSETLMEAQVRSCSSALGPFKFPLALFERSAVLHTLAGRALLSAPEPTASLVRLSSLFASRNFQAETFQRKLSMKKRSTC